MEFKENAWNLLKDLKPLHGMEVICFNPNWIDEDFNLKGIRIGFLNGDDEFTTAYWWDYQDTYETISNSECNGNPSFSRHIQENTEPTHWMDLPEKPIY